MVRSGYKGIHKFVGITLFNLNQCFASVCHYHLWYTYTSLHKYEECNKLSWAQSWEFHFKHVFFSFLLIIICFIKLRRCQNVHWLHIRSMLGCDDSVNQHFVFFSSIVWLFMVTKIYVRFDVFVFTLDHSFFNLFLRTVIRKYNKIYLMWFLFGKNCHTTHIHEI